MIGLGPTIARLQARTPKFDRAEVRRSFIQVHRTVREEFQVTPQINIVKRVVARPPQQRNRCTLADWRHAASHAPSDAGQARCAGPAASESRSRRSRARAAAPACPTLPRREHPGPRTDPTVELAPPASHPQGRGRGGDFCSLPQVAGWGAAAANSGCAARARAGQIGVPLNPGPARARLGPRSRATQHFSSS